MFRGLRATHKPLKLFVIKPEESCVKLKETGASPSKAQSNPRKL